MNNKFAGIIMGGLMALILIPATYAATNNTNAFAQALLTHMCKSAANGSYDNIPQIDISRILSHCKKSNMLLDNVYYTVVDENDIWVRGSLSSTKDIAQRYIFEASTTNKQFNFAGAYMFASTTPNIISEYRKGYFLNSDGDDTTPVNTNNVGYIGANHGLIVSQVTSNNHDKTTEDIGSLWVNNRRQYILAEINGKSLVFYPVPSGNLSTGTWRMYWPTSNALSHIQDATHDSDILIDSSTFTQRYPIQKNQTHSVLINGETEITSGSGHADFIDIVDEYDVVDPSTLNTNNKPFIWDDTEDIWFHVKTVYRVYAGKTIVHTTYTIQKPLDVGYLGFLQVGRLNNGGVYNDRYYYIPKTKPIGDYHFATPQQFNISSGPSINFTAEYLNDQNNPPDREIMYLKRNTDTAYQVGLAFGYGPFSITSRNCSLSSGGCWRISAVQKNYPMYLVGNGVVNNVTYDVVGYRQWTDPSEYNGEKSIYWNNQDGHIVLYLDYHKNFKNDVVRLPQPFIGKAITILESHNMTVEDPEVLPEGLHVSGFTDDSYSYAVIELVDTE